MSQEAMDATLAGAGGEVDPHDPASPFEFSRG
jgi:hypothetical protein